MTHKSRVYFIPASETDKLALISQKLNRLLMESGILNCLQGKPEVIFKLHFGEEGNTGFVRPQYVGVIAAAAVNLGAKVFLADTNTLYRGKRLNCRDHLKLAAKHGFTQKNTHAQLIIPDDRQEAETVRVKIGRKFIQEAKIARIFIEAPALIAVSHFKGHILTGFGGALKNIGMGCATRAGKLAQHCNSAPVVHLEKCVGCKKCIAVCPADAISLEHKKAVVDTSRCIGCATCLAACPTMAMFIDFNAGSAVQFKMAEYCLAVLQNKPGGYGFINFATRINQECDCWGAHNPRIAPDLGILASFDPVSIDQASLDLINQSCGKDIFKQTHPQQDGCEQLRYAEEIGLGTRDYELIKL